MTEPDSSFDKPEDTFRTTERKLREKITQLKADLAKYGGHTADCACRNLQFKKGDDGLTRILDAKECDCGWADTKPKPQQPGDYTELDVAEAEIFKLKNQMRHLAKMKGIRWLQHKHACPGNPDSGNGTQCTCGYDAWQETTPGSPIR